MASTTTRTPDELMAMLVRAELMGTAPTAVAEIVLREIEKARRERVHSRRPMDMETAVGYVAVHDMAIDLAK